MSEDAVLYEPLPFGKICRVCNQWKPYAELVHHKDCIGNVDTLCKPCGSLERKAWRKRTLPQRKERGRLFYAEHRADIIQKSKNYYQAHKQQKAAYDREYRSRTKDRRRESTATYRRQNKHIIVSCDSRRRTRKLNLPVNFTAEDWDRALEYFGDGCAVCGRPQGLWHIIAADHWIPIASPDCPGTIPENIVPLCNGIDGCNNRKHDKMPKQWLEELYGKRKAARILKRIEEYFEWVKKQH